MVFSINWFKDYLKKTSLAKTLLNYSFLCLLFLSFYAQHVLTFYIYEIESNEQTVVFQFNSSNHHNLVHFKAKFPVKRNFSAIEMELEEDDEVLQAFHPSQIPGSSQFLSCELLMRSLLGAQFHQLKARIDQKAVQPLFVLHHSWKGYIS